MSERLVDEPIEYRITSRVSHRFSIGGYKFGQRVEYFVETEFARFGPFKNWHEVWDAKCFMESP